MSEYYDHDELLKIFEQHEKKAIVENQRLIEGFKKDYPNDPLPSHFEEDFSLPKALKTILNELIEIKAKNENINSEYMLFVSAMQNSLCVIDKYVSELQARLNTLENK